MNPTKLEKKGDIEKSLRCCLRAEENVCEKEKEKIIDYINYVFSLSWIKHKNIYSSSWFARVDALSAMEVQFEHVWDDVVVVTILIRLPDDHDEGVEKYALVTYNHHPFFDDKCD